MLRSICLALALVCFGLAAFEVKLPRADLKAIGLALFTIAAMLGG